MRTITLLTVIVIITSAGCRTNVQYPDCNSKDIELMDSCLVGMTIQEAIAKLNLDTSNFIPMLIFAREIHGIYIRMPDCCKITVIIDTPFILSNEQMKAIETNGWLNSSWKSIYKYILHQKIIGLCWRKDQEHKVKVVGNMKYHDCWDT